MALHKLERRNYGGKLPVSIKYQNLHTFKEGLILLCQSILEVRRITHLHGSAQFTIPLRSVFPGERVWSWLHVLQKMNQGFYFKNFVSPSKSTLEKNLENLAIVKLFALAQRQIEEKKKGNWKVFCVTHKRKKTLKCDKNSQDYLWEPKKNSSFLSPTCHTDAEDFIKNIQMDKARGLNSILWKLQKYYHCLKRVIN